MKIIHIISSLEVGGAQRLLTELLPRQLQSGLDVSLLVFQWIDNDFTKIIETSGVPIISLNQKNIMNPLIVFGIRKLLKKYDIAHVHLFPTSYWAALATIGLRKTKLVWTEHSTSNKRRGKWYFRPIEKFIYCRYSKLVSISPKTQEALESWIQKKGSRFVVINNGVDIAKYTSTRRPIIPKSLIMVSRFVPSKDQKTVIRAMQYVPDDVRLFLVGDGETLSRCKHLSEELGLTERITFLGARYDIPELVASSYIGVQSSNWEGFGLTAVEQMAAGKPVVASNVDGLKQVVEGAGLLFEPGNEKDLSEKINLLLEDKSYYELVSDACMKRASEYDLSHMVRGYIDIYKDLYNK